MSLASFAVVSLLGMAIPGPDVVLAITNGSRYGPRRAFYGTLGVVLSDLILILIVAVGFSALLAASELCLNAIRIGGAVYLLLLGWAALKASAHSGKGVAPVGAEAHTAKALFARCFVVAITNPEAWLFFPAILPPFIDTSRPIGAQYAILALILVLSDVIVLMLFATFGHRSARLLGGPNAHWIDRLYGAALMGLACFLLVQSAAQLGSRTPGLAALPTAQAQATEWKAPDGADGDASRPGAGRGVRAAFPDHAGSASSGK